MYLEDMGPVPGQEESVQLPVSQISSGPSPDYQVVWQLEMWKRAEMAKFLVHLKQKEIEKIEQVTSDWKLKEATRD